MLFLFLSLKILLHLRDLRFTHHFALLIPNRIHSRTDPVGRCVVTMQVRGYVSVIILFSTFRSVATSSAEVASSSSRIGDFRSTARAIESRCACPSENPPPRSFTILSIPSGSFSTKSQAHASFNASMISSSVASGFTFRIFSAIVPENIVFPCGT